MNRKSVPGETPYPHRIERKKSTYSSSSSSKDKKRNSITASRSGSQGILKGDNNSAHDQSENNDMTADATDP